MRDSKQINVQVVSTWGDITHRYDPKTTFEELDRNYQKMFSGLPFNPALIEHLSARFAARALQLYKEKATAQLDATMQSMLTQAMDKAFDENSQELLLIGVPAKSMRAVRMAMKKVRERFQEEEYRYVWGGRSSGRPSHSLPEKLSLQASKREEILSKSIEIVHQLQASGERHVTHTDVARKMFAHLSDFKDMRRSYSRALQEANLNFNHILSAAEKSDDRIL